MKKIALGLALMGLIWLGMDYRNMRHEQRELRKGLEASGQSLQWLSEPVLEVGDKKYSRAQLLDLLLAKALKAN